MEWQPIETAPKDRRVLLYYPVSPYGEHFVVFGRWADERYASCPRPHWSHDMSHLWGARASRAHQPTHWAEVPLPS